MNENKENVAQASDAAEPPVLTITVGKNLYRVGIHFSATGRETMEDKIQRLLRREVQDALTDK